MRDSYAKKNAASLFERYPIEIQTFENAYNIVVKTYEYKGRHCNISRIIDFLKKVNNVPKNLNVDHIIYYIDLLEKRIVRLKNEGRHQSIIDISLYQIFCKNDDDAVHYYNEMVMKKTKILIDNPLKDSKSLEFHIRKYGIEKGSEIYENKKKNGYYKENANTCIEYYLKRGYTEKEAKILISERQKTFTIEKCIEKHGIIEGTKIWEDRQKRWQKTLSNKPQTEIDEINKKKNIIYAMKVKGYDNKCIVENIENRSRIKKKLFHTLESFEERIKEDIQQNKIGDFIHIKEIISLYTHSQFMILNIEDPFVFMSNYLNVVDNYDNGCVKQLNKYNNFTLRVNEGMLRSSYEILFYELLCHKNIEFILDKQYPQKTNTKKLRFDFYLPKYDLYIEISPRFTTDETIRNKVLVKQSLFGCIILKTKNEIYEFVDSLS
jgi:hypothetical protein